MAYQSVGLFRADKIIPGNWLIKTMFCFGGFHDEEHGPLPSAGQ